MTLNEMLVSPEAKKMYKELSQKHHPDKGGDMEVQKKINAAKDKGDIYLKNLYKELTKKKKVYNDISSNDFEKQWKNIRTWINQIKKEIPSILFILPRKNVNNTIYINIVVRNTAFNILNGHKIKSYNELKRIITSKMSKM